MAYEILKFDKEFKHSNNAHFTDFYHCCLKMYCLLQSCSKADNNEVFYYYIKNSPFGWQFCNKFKRFFS